MIYAFAKFVISIYMFLFLRISFEGRENIPEKGGLLMYSNHPSAFDMFLVATRIKRKVHYMAKAELFRNPVLAFLVRELGAFPVQRGRGDTGSVKNAMALLDKGEVVGIFPEGTRVRERSSEKKKGGAALIAYHSGAPILPVGIEGRGRIFSKVRVVYGKPFTLQIPEGEKPEREDLYAGTTEILDKIYALIGK